MDTVTFFLTRNGSTLEKTIRRGQITSERLSLIFKLVPSSIYITEEYGSSEFPDEEGNFPCFQGNEGAFRYEVEGDDKVGSNHQPNQLDQPRPSSFRSRLSMSSSSSQSRKRPAAGSSPLCSLKVILAEMENRKIKNHIQMQYVTITSETANVNDITEKVKICFDNRNLILVQANGLRIEENETTNEISFWKSNARKVFCVDRESFNSTLNIKVNMENQIGQILESLNEMKDKVSNAVSVVCSNTEDTQTIRNSLKSLQIFNDLKEIFHCIVCIDVITPPVAISSCCKRVLGCGICIDRWFQNNETMCPHCRSLECNHIVLNSFDNIIRNFVH